MAKPPVRSPLIRAGRLLAAGVLALTTTAATLAVTSGAPAAADIAQQIDAGQARLDRLNTEAEAAAERYDAGRIRLTQAQQVAQVARAALAREDTAVAALRTQAGIFVANAYRSGGDIGPVSALINAAGPQAAIDQMNLLDQVSRNQSAVLSSLATARSRQATAAATAQAAQDNAATTLAGLQADKSTVEDNARQAQKVLADLQVKQAALVRAAKQVAERKAAELRAAQLAQQARLSKAALAEFHAQPASPDVAQAPPAPVTRVASTSPSSAGGAAQTALRTAMAQLGKPYVWAADGPNSFDCSGLTMFAYARAGISLPHHAASQFNQGRHVGKGDLRPGDLVFFESNLGHMGMYVGGGRFIHAPHTGDVVKISDMSSGYYANEYAGAVRLAG